MANEITMTVGAKLINGTLRSTESNHTAQFTQATARGGSWTVDIGTSEETITWGDIVPGYVKLINLDPTNFVSYGVVTLNLDFEIEAVGGCAIFKMATGAALIMQADKAICKVQITAFNL